VTDRITGALVGWVVAVIGVATAYAATRLGEIARASHWVILSAVLAAVMAYFVVVWAAGFLIR
jgi:hypothetical protein